MDSLHAKVGGDPLDSPRADYIVRAMPGPPPTSAIGPWSEPELPAFEVREGESLAAAVERDLEDCIARHGEFPAIERYRATVDPALHSESAERIVLAAFDASPRFRRELADGWRGRYPAWSTAIDRGVAVAVLSDDDDPEVAVDGAPIRIGAPLDDGAGRYELLGLLGRGASGSVYRAADRALSQCGAPVEVALKIVPCAPSMVEALLREAGAARAISDSGVARVLDAASLARASLGARAADTLGLDAAGIAIATELIDGVPLFIWKALHPERSHGECERLISRVEAALLACHAKGIAHGDLSPANILVERDGSPRVVDFGHASWSIGERAGRANGAEVDAAAPAPELERQFARDHARVSALRAWLVRDLRDGRARNAARRRRQVGAAVALLVATMTLVVWAMREPARDPSASQESAASDGFASIFGQELDGEPELALALRELLVSGMLTSLTEERATALARALRAEAGAIATDAVVSRSQQTRLLAAATLSLAVGEAQWAAPLAVLAAQCDVRDETRLRVAQAIADIARSASMEQGSGAFARTSLERLSETVPVDGLRFLLESIERQGVPGPLGADSGEAPAGASRASSQR